jgi:drug/metabolite transporter superfamily protein YnfA
MYGLHRGAWTLIGAAATLILVWIAALMQEHTTGGYWATYGLIAAAGLALALAPVIGGWTKWGWPRLSGGVFLIGFVPTLIVSAWILLTTQPAQGWQHARLNSWSSDMGVLHFIHSVQPYKAVFALTVGLVFGFTFDTAGPRRAVEPAAVGEHPAADEPITRERSGFLHRRRRDRTLAGREAE